MKKSNSGVARYRMVSGFSAILVVVLVLLLAAIIGGVYYLGTKKNNLRPVPSLNSPLPIPTSKTVGGWKIFNAGHFSVEYPSGWDMPPSPPLVNTESFTLFFHSPDYKTPEKGAAEEVLRGARIELFVIPNQKIPSLEEWFNKFFYDPASQRVLYKPRKVFVDVGPFTHVGALEYDGTQLEGKFYSKVFTVGVGDTIYQFNIVSKGETDNYKPILDHMISSFKFTQ